MNSLIACVPRGVTSEDVCDQLSACGIHVEFRNGRITVSNEGSIAWIERDSAGELKREYERDELTLLSGLIGEWVGFVIDYRTIEVAVMAVRAMCERWPCVVDNDDDFIGWGREYVERQRSTGRRGVDGKREPVAGQSAEEEVDVLLDAEL
ncbi:hypothetical protein OHA71_34480 [Streptomyces sp. NBC_00444]